VFPSHSKVDLIDDYIINKDNYLPIENHNLCIIKSSLSDNITQSGVIDINIINNFCNKNNLLFLEPTKMNEIELINTINQSKIFVTSWGTAFFKNYVYISDNCEKIIVLVIGDFIHQYNHAKETNSLSKKYKNASIHYYITDSCLDLDLTI
jgi:hypothetical protein